LTQNLPEIVADAEISDWICSVCSKSGVLERLERTVGGTGGLALDFFKATPWRIFSSEVSEIWRREDYVVVRGVPVLAEGASLLLVSLCLSHSFKTYRGHRIVKKFRMSPWTADLSHTTKEGHFHTDLNTSPSPPAITAIQCLTPDPGAPEYGNNRVARLVDLLAHLESAGRAERVRVLRELDVAMLNDHAQETWRGHIVEGDSIRYHPETIRAALRRFKQESSSLEEIITELHEAALAVSQPFQLQEGDILFVANHHALHYRGECSVTFTEFPLSYEARSIYVLHLLSEP
jgi:hypothetical protein